MLFSFIIKRKASTEFIFTRQVSIRLSWECEKLDSLHDYKWFLICAFKVKCYEYRFCFMHIKKEHSLWTTKLFFTVHFTCLLCALFIVHLNLWENIVIIIRIEYVLYQVYAYNCLYSGLYDINKVLYVYILLLFFKNC